MSERWVRLSWGPCARGAISAERRAAFLRGISAHRGGGGGGGGGGVLGCEYVWVPGLLGLCPFSLLQVAMD